MNDTIKRIDLAPCPFCEGPPVPHGDHQEAYVFCHECGARGPIADLLLFQEGDLLFLDVTAEHMEQMAMRLWNDRNSRHRDVYDANQEALRG